MKYLCFIGRWVTFHDGHKYIIKKVYEEKKLPVLILVRNTNEEPDAIIRLDVINEWLKENKIKGKAEIFHDIEGIYFGRGVGYNIEEVEVPENIKEISGTKIREKNNA